MRLRRSSTNAVVAPTPTSAREKAAEAAREAAAAKALAPAGLAGGGGQGGVGRQGFGGFEALECGHGWSQPGSSLLETSLERRRGGGRRGFGMRGSRREGRRDVFGMPRVRWLRDIGLRGLGGECWGRRELFERHDWRDRGRWFGRYRGLDGFGLSGGLRGLRRRECRGQFLGAVATL